LEFGCGLYWIDGESGIGVGMEVENGEERITGVEKPRTWGERGG